MSLLIPPLKEQGEGGELANGSKLNTTVLNNGDVEAMMMTTTMRGLPPVRTWRNGRGAKPETTATRTRSQ